jgi:L-rhamnono-1,4-lactonase
MTSTPQPQIIDSHIHLYARPHLATLRWAPSLPSNHVLGQQNSVQEYRSAISSAAASVRGFVFIESDRLSSLSDDSWGYALDEIEFLARIAQGKPRIEKDEGFKAADKEFVLGIVPWAPVPAGPQAMERYMGLVQERCGSEEIWERIKGVRYLVQDKPPGVMLGAGFIESLKWLGEKNLTFDLGVDARSGGMSQLKEACEMMRLIYDDKQRGATKANVEIVINHLCKPNLHLTPRDIANADPSFIEWKSCIEEMASYEESFMKLSGGFSELPSQKWEEPGCLDRIVQILKPWTDVAFATFGTSRIMFGSDWPVCNVGGPGVELSWQYWHDIVEAILSARCLSDDEKAMVWSGNARIAYNIP